MGGGRVEKKRNDNEEKNDFYSIIRCQRNIVSNILLHPVFGATLIHTRTHFISFHDVFSLLLLLLSILFLVLFHFVFRFSFRFWSN